MAEIATALAINAAEQLVGKLIGSVYDRISGELSLLRGLREAVQDILRELKMMNAYLRDVEEKTESTEVVRTCVNEVKTLSYEIEDCLDEVSLHLQDQCSQNTADMATLHKCLHRLVFSCGSLGDRYRIARQIQMVKSKAEKIQNIKERYGITNAGPSLRSEKYMGAHLNSQLAALCTEDSQLVGIDERRTELLKLLDQNEHGLRLIVVVGGGGMGKTTLAQKAYDVLNFTCRAWVTVSQVYHPEELLKKMIKQLNPSSENNMDELNRVELAIKVREYLKDKRYVIVLDDMWKEDAWESLRYALPSNDLGSRVILTTRNVALADVCRSQIPNDIYYPPELSSEQSMELFCKRAFNNPEQRSCPEDLEEVTEGILRKCGGLPLAIISIAGLVASKPNKTVEEWENILRHLGSKLLGPLKGTERVFTLSYNDLPPEVKPCLLYLSNFPEDYEIQRKHIQRLWIAEGFVTGRDGMPAEVVAECYFNELANRFLILPTKFSKVNGKVKTFRVHDIILELIVSRSHEENFVTVLGKNSGGIPSDVIRRLSTHSSYDPQNMCLSYVRSLFMFRDGITTISPSMRMLRVLNVDTCDAYHSDDHFIDDLGQLIHLKYLRIRSTKVRSLPESLGNLRNLETLDIRGSGSLVIEIPSWVSKLQQLRVLRGDNMFAPRGIWRLRNLQELSRVWLLSENMAREIGNLTQVRDLGFRWPYRVASGELCKSLEKLSSSLRSLKVWGLFPQGCASLDNLSSPPLLLESLYLAGGYGNEVVKKFPRRWVGQLNKAVRITLERIGLSQGDIRVLGSLPNLLKLHLNDNRYSVGRLSFGAEEGFPRLKVLHLSWRNKDVRGLRFDHIDEGEAVEGSIGIKNLPSLTEVTIKRVESWLWDAIIAEIEEHPNHPRLIL